MIGSQAMNTEHIVSMLVAERDRLNRAIEALQGPAKRRGRPPLALAAAAVAPAVPAPAKAKPTRGRRKLTPAEKKAASERMKAYWAARRKAQKPKG
jgi:hypothetical protein